jgi:hypothetical protein
MATSYILNRSPQERLKWKSPYQALIEWLKWTTLLLLTQMHKYGCLAYPRINNQPKLNRLNSRAEIRFLVGWQSSNIYHVWIPSRNKVIFSRDVTFNEEGKWDSKRKYNPISLHEDIDPIFIELPEKEVEGDDIDEL